MCDFLSFWVNADCGEPGVETQILCADHRSHYGTQIIMKFKEDEFREAEWTADDGGGSLVVRCGPNDVHDQMWYKACILSSFPTRDLILMHILSCWPSTALNCYGCTGLKALPDLPPGLTALFCQGCPGLKALPNKYPKRFTGSLQSLISENKAKAEKGKRT